MRRALALTAAAVLLVVAGCSSDPDEAAAPETTTTAEQPATEQPTTVEPTTDPSATAPGAVAGPDGERLQGALLTTADLPDDFSLVTEQGDVRAGLLDSCLAPLEDLDSLEAESRAKATFSDGLVTEVEHSLATFADEDELTGAISTVRSALEGCDEITVEDDRVSLVLSISTDAGSGAQGADESFVLDAEGEATVPGLDAALPITMRFDLARMANHVSMVTVATMGGDSPVDAEELAGEGFSKLQAAVGD